MIEEDDPFTGTWTFNPQRSKLSTPLPQRWVQIIFARPDEIVVREHIIRSDGTRTEVRVSAKFDGTDYPISGLPIAEFMAYTRVNSHTISGTGRKNGVVALSETVTVAPDGKTLTLIYSVPGTSQIARGIAVFEKA